MRPFLPLILLSAAGFVAAPAIAGPGNGPDGRDTAVPLLILYGDADFRGGAVTLDRNVDNLQDIHVADSDSGTANDYAMSARSVGRWQVCMDAGHVTDCRVVDGETRDFGEQGRSISSVRYLGPGTAPVRQGSDTGARVEERVHRALRALRGE